MAPTPYDTNIKFLLADKQILARILKYAVQEFKDMTIEDIMSSIGKDIEIGTRPLDAGLSNMGRVNVSCTEDNIPGEGKIFFDIRFTAYHKETEMKFLINLEAQRLSDPSKCLDNSEDGDSIEEINLDRNTVYGNKRNLYDIDLMRGIIINVRTGENIKDSQNVLISLLEKLLSKMSIEEKKRILTEKYGMIMTTELEGRMQTMCNWSEAIKEMSFEEGVKKERLNAIERMIQANFTKEQIISCGYTENEFAEAENLLCINA